MKSQEHETDGLSNDLAYQMENNMPWNALE